MKIRNAHIPAAILIVALGLALGGAGIFFYFSQTPQLVTTAQHELALVPICTSEDEKQNFTCYENHYRELVENAGIAAAFLDLRARYGTDAYVTSQCHPIVHVIGRTAAGSVRTVSEAYTQGDSFCWSGYYHGVMEGIVGKIGRGAIAQSLDTICADIPGKKSYTFDYYNCVHGLGHGLMAVTDDELFDSLKYCDALTGSWEQSSCAGGVFMENVIIDNKNHFTKFLKPNDPLYPCSAVSEKHKPSCFLMQTSYMLKVFENDFSKVFKTCRTVAEQYRDICYQSLGRDASGRSLSDVTKTRETCDLGADSREQSHCIIGAVKDFISYHHSDTQARTLCASLEPNLQPLCFRTAESHYRSFN